MNSKTQSLLNSANLHPNESSVSFDKRVFSDHETAQQAFSKLKIDLLNIDEWNKHSAFSSHELFDENGNILQKQIIHEGAFNRIDLKGSGKYDWVKFIEIYEATDELLITVTPTYDPTAKPIDKTLTSHFLIRGSTNNFCLLMNENSVSLYVIGLGEKQNTTETKSTLEIIRNVATANIGHYFGIQKGEWTAFCKSFLDSVA